jgi:hypothetical protein
VTNAQFSNPKPYGGESFVRHEVKTWINVAYPDLSKPFFSSLLGGEPKGITATPLARRPARQMPPRPIRRAATLDVADADLRNALARLGAAIKRS